jgi:hypothetical protein
MIIGIFISRLCKVINLIDSIELIVLFFEICSSQWITKNEIEIKKSSNKLII